MNLNLINIVRFDLVLIVGAALLYAVGLRKTGALLIVGGLFLSPHVSHFVLGIAKAVTG